MKALIKPNPFSGSVRYRFYWIVGNPVDKFVVVDKLRTNVMPGAATFRTVSEASRAIDALIAVRHNADMFWEIMQPFAYTPGDRVSENGRVEKGRHYAVVVNGVVTEIGCVDEDTVPKVIGDCEACGAEVHEGVGHDCMDHLEHERAKRHAKH